MVRLPETGRVKTRLAQAIGAAAACRFYEACVRDLVVQSASWPCRVVWAVAPEGEDEGPASVSVTPGSGARVRGRVSGRPALSVVQRFAERFAVAPEACLEQQGRDLGQRLETTLDRLRAAGAVCCLAVGSDLPHLPVAALARAIRRLAAHDLVLGPTRDGGYYLIGLSRPAALFTDIAWSTPSVYPQTLARARACGLRIAPPLAFDFDIDEARDLEALRRRVARDAELRQRLPATARVLAALPPPSSRGAGPAR